MNVNSKESEYHNYSLYEAFAHSNLEVVKLIINYAKQNNVILTMDNNKNGKSHFHGQFL